MLPLHTAERPPRTLWPSAGLVFGVFLVAAPVLAQEHPSSTVAPAVDPAPARFAASLQGEIPPQPQTMPLYQGEIPNSIAGPDRESSAERMGETWIDKVSHPTITVFRPAPKRASDAAVLVFPGGGYTGLSWSMEGTRIGKALEDHGCTAIVVKYRLPSDATMKDKSIGPLQDAQQALRVARQHAKEWGIDPRKIGAMGFSAGGHLAATLATHFGHAYIPNADGVNLRPDFVILVYPVISMKPGLTHMGSHDALLGTNPPEAQVDLFSNERQITDRTPPTLILHATDDLLVDVNNSVEFYAALHRHQVPVQMVLFDKGNHGFFEIPSERWQSVVWAWLRQHGWTKD